MARNSADVKEIVAETVQGLGFEFVEIEHLPRGLVRVTIDTEREGGVGVDDCEAVSDQLTRVFAVEGIDFERLEVSSPGVDRPLKRACDWRRFTGRCAHVELYEPLHAEGLPQAGRRKFDGHIVAFDAEHDCVEFSIEELQFARTPSEAARAKRTHGKAPEVAPVLVRFELNDIDRANLIAQLDFKGNKR